jgi:hypothetical protein
VPIKRFEQNGLQIKGHSNFYIRRKQRKQHSEVDLCVDPFPPKRAEPVDRQIDPFPLFQRII